MCRCGGAGEHEHLLDPKAVETRSLYDYLMVPLCTTLNLGTGDLTKVLARTFQSSDPSAYIKSDCDDQMIVQLTFSGCVKIKSIKLAVGREHCPANMQVYANQLVDFTTMCSKKPTQEFGCISDPKEHQEEVIEYALKAHLFGNVSNMSIVFNNTQQPHTLIRFLGFSGDFLNSKAAPVITQYELKPQLSDHKNETEWQKAGHGGVGF